MDRRPMRIFPRNETAEERQRDQDAFDRISVDIDNGDLPGPILSPREVFEQRLKAMEAPSDAGSAPKDGWWKRLLGKLR